MTEQDETEAARRAGRREANLRMLNERIAESQQHEAVLLESPLTVLCECARDDCEDSIVLGQDVFDEIRSHHGRFIVREGHVLHDIEDVVERGDGWVAVEKRGEAAREAKRVLG